MFYVCPHKKYFMKPLLWMSFCLLTGTCLAQKKLSMKDAVLGLSSHLAINNLVQPHWQKNTSNFIYGLKIRTTYCVTMQKPDSQIRCLHSPISILQPVKISKKFPLFSGFLKNNFMYEKEILFIKVIQPTTIRS